MHSSTATAALNANTAPGSGPTLDFQPTPVFLMTNDLQTGGSERQFAALTRSLNPDLFQVFLGCLKRRGTIGEEMAELVEFDLGGSFFTMQSLRARMTLHRFLRAKGIAVAHSFDFYSNLLLLPVARVAGVPVIIGSHRQIGDLLTPLQLAAQGVAFRMCDRVLCNSRAAANHLIIHGTPEEKVVIIRNGLPTSAFAQTTPLFPPRPGVLRVGMVARMNHPVKNHAGFLRAAATIARKFQQVEFLLAGDGHLRPGLERKVESLGLRPRVHFLGDRSDVPAVFASMDISVVASFSESSSNAILESMAAGVPVVATRVGGTPEIVEDHETGFLIPPGDDERLTEVLEYLLSNPEVRRACGERSRRFTQANFSMDHMHREVEQLYATLLQQKGWQPRQKARFQMPAGVPPRPIRVAIVAASRRWIGGHSVQAELLTRHWKDDAAVQAQYLPIDPEFPSWLSWIERFPYLRTIARMPLYWAQLWRGLAQADIAHIFSASYWSFLLAPVPAWLIARLRGKLVLIHYHSGEAEDHLRRWRTARFVLKRADRLVVPSGYLVGIFQSFGLKAWSVPNIVDFSQFNYRPRQPLRPSLICTRGFEPYYSVDLVVKTFAKIKEVFPEARLLLVGRGTLDSEIRALVRHLKLEHVEFSGPVSPEKMGALYDRADIFINASWLDNMPVSILEAFASGTPVVSTAPEGIRYVVEHERTGLLCARGDWKALVENVLRLLHEPGLARTLAQNAFQKSHNYRWEAVRDRWFEVYSSLLRSRGEGHLETTSSLLSPQDAPANHPIKQVD